MSHRNQSVSSIFCENTFEPCHKKNSSTVIPTTSKKEVRFEGEYQDTLPRSRSYSGKSSRSSGRRRKGTRQKKQSPENRLNDPQSQSSRHRQEHRKSSRKSRHSCSTNEEPSTSNQSKLKADVVDGHRDDDDDTETTRSNCSTCSSSSSDSDDFTYELPQRQVYGGVRVNYVPNDALACARKEQQQQQQFKIDQSNSSDRDKNCIIS